jgi:ABC-2 type transport system permease protein
MQTFITLARREWMQHRFGWALLVAVPLALAVLALSFTPAEVNLDTEFRLGELLPTMLTGIALVGGALGLVLLLILASVVFMIGLPRRDDADRSVEFWLSMPVSHSASLGVPLAVHLLLVPMVALLVGLACGALVSLVLVARTVGIGDWFAQPWGLILPAIAGGAGRLLVGIPLAILWLLPLILLLMWFVAVFKRWGLPALVVSQVGLNFFAERFGAGPVVADTLGFLLQRAATALIGEGDSREVGNAADVVTMLQEIPAMAWQGTQEALLDAASAPMLMCLLASALRFAALVAWRRRGA